MGKGVVVRSSHGRVSVALGEGAQVSEAPMSPGATAVSEATDVLAPEAPYIVTVAIEGVADLLFHRWTNEAVEQKASSPKGSKTRKTDDVESYVYRDSSGQLCIPGEYLRQAVIGAAKFMPDPRSPRKSAIDLYKAGVIALTPLAPLGVKDWDYLDRRRVMLMRNGITRVRPAMLKGWKAQFDLLVNLPEYIPPAVLNQVIQQAGRLIGIGDFRPTYGRFVVTHFEVKT